MGFLASDGTGGLEAGTLRRMYWNERMSMAEIAARTGCSVHKIVYWMDRHGISRRNWAQATYAKRNRTEPFHLKQKLSPEDEKLKALAIGLFLGEGNRRSTREVRVGNSDPLVLHFFVRFLREVCGVRDEKLRLNLVIHPDVEKDAAERLWSVALDIPLTQFQKTTVLQPRGKGTYRHRCRYGVATVLVCNTKLRALIQRWIEEYAQLAQWQSTAMVRPLREFDSPTGLGFSAEGDREI